MSVIVKLWMLTLVVLSACQSPQPPSADPRLDRGAEDAGVPDRGMDADVEPDRGSVPALPDMGPPDAFDFDASEFDVGFFDTGAMPEDAFVADPEPQHPRRIRLRDVPGIARNPALVAYRDGWLTAWSDNRLSPFNLAYDDNLLVVQVLGADGTPQRTDTVRVPELRGAFELQSDDTGSVVMWIERQRPIHRLMAIRWTADGFSAPHALRTWDSAAVLSHVERVENGWHAYVRHDETVRVLTISQDATRFIDATPLLEGVDAVHVAPPWIAWRQDSRLSWARLESMEAARHLEVDGRVRWLTGSSTADALVLAWAIEDRMYAARLDEGVPGAPSVLPLLRDSSPAPVVSHDADGVVMGITEFRRTSVMRWTPQGGEWLTISGPRDTIRNIDFAVNDGRLATLLTSDIDRRPDVWFVPGLPQPEPYVAPAAARCDATVRLMETRGIPHPPRLGRENGQLRLFWPTFRAGHGWQNAYLDIYAADPAPGDGRALARYEDPEGRWTFSRPVFALGDEESWLIDSWGAQLIDAAGQFGPFIRAWEPRVSPIAAAIHGDRLGVFGRAGDRLVVQIGAHHAPEEPAITVDLGPIDPDATPFVEARMIANDDGFAVGWTHRETPDSRPQVAVISRAGQMRWHAEADAPWGASWSPRITWEGAVVSLAWVQVDTGLYGRADAYAMQWENGQARPLRRLTWHGTLGIEIGPVDGGYAAIWGDDEALVGQRFNARFESLGTPHILGGPTSVFGARRTPSFGAVFEADQVVFARYRDGHETTSRRRVEVGIRPLDCFGPVVEP